MSQSVGNTSLAVSRVWHHFSARDAILGKLSVQVALLLMGKNKPIFDPSQDVGDYVVITNARHVKVTGKKDQQKVYRHHSMFPGGLKEIKYEDMLQKKPEEVSKEKRGSPEKDVIIRKAVSGMLPKNTFRDRRLDRLLVFADDEHPYEANIIKRYDLGDTFKQPKSLTK